MDELIWLDRFTGTRYRCDAAWQAAVRRHIVDGLRSVLAAGGTTQELANAAARFWHNTYYRQVFPLRFGLGEEDGWLQAPPAFPEANQVDLGPLAGRPLRQSLLDKGCLPPILPDARRGSEGWLLADRLLIEAALLNVLLAQTAGMEEERHAARLAALIYPFLAELADIVASDPRVEAIARALAGGPSAAALSAPLNELVCAVRDQQLGDRRLDIVLVAVQRVKQYVFETSGLNEIRGGSTLLDEVTDNLRVQVGKEIGPEVVLRAAGATLLFLAPATDGHSPWPARLREEFYRATGTAFPAAAAITVRAQDLFTAYGEAVSRTYAALAADRAQAIRPEYQALPFEARCELCRIRPADGWDVAPGLEDIPNNRRPVCRVCKTKRDWGKAERRGKVHDVLRRIGYEGNLAALGIKPGSDWLASDLEKLIPAGVRRKLIGIVYGDGNNFGRISMGLPDIALGIQWAKRVEQTTQAAAALALGQATQRAAALRSWTPGGRPVMEKVPFQVLALGGDDLSLFAWAPVAIYFAAEFTRLTDLEFRATGSDRLSPDPLIFSLGTLVTDEKAPVARSVEFTEHELMGWAKRASKEQKLAYGNIAMVYAQTAEAIPSDLKRYRDEVYLLGAGERFRLCTTLRPWTAAELRMLLDGAELVVRDGHLGRLQRLAAAFYGARQGALAGMLYYAYQKGRAARDGTEGWIQELEARLAAAGGHARDETLLVHYQPQKTARLLFGLSADAGDATQTNRVTIWHAPLWDLVELAKLMS